LEHITKDFDDLRNKYPEYIKINFVDFFIRMSNFYSAQITDQYFLIYYQELSLKNNSKYPMPIMIDSLIKYKNTHPKEFEIKRYTE